MFIIRNEEESIQSKLSEEPELLYYKKEPVFGRLKLSPFKRFSKNLMKNEACFIFVEEGSFNLRSPYEEFMVNKDQGILLKNVDYYLEHTNKLKEDDSGLEIIGVFLYPEMIQELMDYDFIDTKYVNEFYGSGVSIDKVLRHYRAGIKDLFEYKELVSDQMLACKLKEFIMLMVYSGNAIDINELLSGLYKVHVIDFRKAIEANQFSNLSLVEWAHLTGMSLASFKRKFAEIYGMPPKKYLSLKKLEQAANVLIKTDQGVLEIALNCGFNSLNTFNRNFKSCFKTTPSEYRKNYKNKVS